ncbi:MAG: hypothetical protein ACLUJG_10815 [Lawsonibacter sp.]
MYEALKAGKNGGYALRRYGERATAGAGLTEGAGFDSPVRVRELPGLPT